jgi:hypothetical protein
MKSLGVSLVRSPPSLKTGRFLARTSFHKWGRKQGLASDPEERQRESVGGVGIPNDLRRFDTTNLLLSGKP